VLLSPESPLEEGPVKVQDQVQAKEKRASGARRAITLLAIVVLSIAAGVFLGRFYFVRELLLFVAIAALLTFFGANLVMLGILFHAAGRSILQSVQKAKPGIATQEEANTERQTGPLVGNPTIATAAGADSP
jgi:hypothetical protein